MRPFLQVAGTFVRNVAFIAAPLACSACLCYASTTGGGKTTPASGQETAAALRDALSRRGNFDTSPTEPQAPPGFSFGGYHGTDSGGSLAKSLVLQSTTSEGGPFFEVRDSVCSGGGSEQEEGALSWGGGELGNQGLYVTTNLDAALLYGASSSSSSSGVAVFNVFYKNGVPWREPPGIVPPALQFEKFPPEMDRQHDTLSSTEVVGGAEASLVGLPSQYKVTTGKLSSLLLSVRGTVSVNDAFDVSDQIVELRRKAPQSHPQQERKVLPIVRVRPDGNCLFHSLAWSVKASNSLRAAHRASLASNSSFATPVIFGQALEQRALSDELRLEVVAWMQKQLRDGNKEGEDLANRWDLITDGGKENHYFGGARTLSQYLELLGMSKQKMPVFADIQLIAPAVLALYKRPIIVWTDRAGKNKPLIFDCPSPTTDHEAPGWPIELSFTWGSLHYDACAFRGAFVSKL